MLIVSSWNVYGMPFTSPKLLTRQKKWRKIHDQNIIKTVYPKIKNKKNIETDCLAVACFQECWDFRVGIMKPFFYITYYLEKIRLSTYFLKNIINVLMRKNILGASDVSILVFSLSIMLGYIFPNILWDSKKVLLIPFQNNGLSKYSLTECFQSKGTSYIPYQYYIGGCCTYFPKFYKRPLMDSGLFMASNEKPTQYGFEPFTITSLYESFVNKGFLWAYFKKKGKLIINTHLIDKPESEYQQWQLFELLTCAKIIGKHMFKKYHALNLIVIAGDFNFKPTDSCSSIFIKFGYNCISNTSKKTNSRGKVLDYIYAKNINFNKNLIVNTYEPLETKVSDHSIVCSFIENT